MKKKKKLPELLALKRVVSKLIEVDVKLEGMKQVLLDLRESVITALRRAHLEYGINTSWTPEQVDRAVHPKRTKKLKRKEHHHHEA